MAVLVSLGIIVVTLLFCDLIRSSVLHPLPSSLWKILAFDAILSIELCGT